MHLNQNKHGFTLVEVMVAIAVSGILLGGAMGVYSWQKKTSSTQSHVVEMQQALRAASSLINRDLREAKYSPRTNSGEITEMDPDEITFSFENQDNADTLQTIRYSLYDAYADGDDDIGRTVGAGGRVPLVENVEALEFLYLDADGIQTADSDEVQSITVSILIRAERPEAGGDFLNTMDYYPASCPQVVGAQNDACIDPAGDWNFDNNVGNNRNNFNDAFRRRLLINRIYLRN